MAKILEYVGNKKGVPEEVLLIIILGASDDFKNC